MRTRGSVAWAIVGAIASVGGYWMIVRALLRTNLDGLGYFAHAIGAAIAGGIVTACAPVRPWREPVAAALLGVALMSVLFLAAPHPSFSWIAARTSAPWLTAGALAGLSAACAWGGATIGRRITPRLASTAAILVLSALVSSGAFAVCSNAWMGWIGYPTGAAVMLVVFAPMLLAGFAVQAMVPARRPLTCAAGTIVMIAWFVDQQPHVDAAVIGKGVGACAVVAPIAYAGARLGWRVVARHCAADDAVAVPAAVAR